MPLTKTTGVVALALVALWARDAAAQAPTLTVAANGAAVAIAWTPVAGASIYNIVVSGSLNADVNLPASITRVVVNAPAGSYTLRVRGAAAGQFGPFSNAATVTVGGSPAPAPCQPAAPSVTATVNGPSVTVNWGAVSGASGYSVQYSRFAGGTELVQNTTQTSHTQFVGLVGTFFVRVVAVTPCGSATSAEASFTISSLTGNLPRTPDPAPGQLLPKPSYGQSVVTQIAQQYGSDLRNSCVEQGGNNIFLYRVLSALRQRDSRWGLNQKRGNQGMSQDIVTYNPTAGPDNTAQQIYLFDTIGGHCGSSPSWNWGDVTDVTWEAGGAGLCSNRYCALWYIPQQYYQAGFQ
jgi:hypothetical protein